MLKDLLKKALMEAGAIAVGFSRAGELPEDEAGRHARWIAASHHAGMDYLPRHAALKRNPRHVLEDAATVVSIAFSYAPALRRPSGLPAIAAYAYGDDYHDVLRRRLSPVVARMQESFGGDWRICIDSAPLAERWWAMRGGIGRRGLNGCLIIDGAGSYFFLAELLTSLPIEPDTPSEALCSQCGACLKACPTKALNGDGTTDCRRCLNYLTIEHRGPWEGVALEAMQTPAGRHTLYGCDICQHVCPHNLHISPTTIPEFNPRPGIISTDIPSVYTREGILSLTQEAFSRIFKGSPMKRAKLAGIMRNASNLDK